MKKETAPLLALIALASSHFAQPAFAEVSNGLNVKNGVNLNGFRINGFSSNAFTSNAMTFNSMAAYAGASGLELDRGMNDALAELSQSGLVR